MTLLEMISTALSALDLLQRFSKRVIAVWLAGKLLKTKDAVRLALDDLGTVGIGINWNKAAVIKLRDHRPPGPEPPKLVEQDNLESLNRRRILCNFLPGLHVGLQILSA
jgi:hypothetical protein